MFRTLLIANRGEIACRIIRTARRMGIRTVAVYSEADARARHVREADEAFCIGPAPAAQSYLNIDAILAAAHICEAEAVHPGYGFLSENATFAQACADAGLTFVGPPAQAMLAMGDKAAAKALMMAQNIPLTPGYHGEDQSDVHLQAKADAIGYPVLIKPSAGGGGKGMHVVEKREDFFTHLATARREAAASFGDERMLLEKYLTHARHVEMQIFTDTHGNGVYLFERDCSVQRRHQKVLEEAPAPGFFTPQRQQMGAIALAAAQAVSYVGAGTVEFILDADSGAFYFMEMNTRLQVEHPVTEMVTGVDLVEWQLRVAAGEPLPLKQSQLALHGHAIEVRIYAEDPERGFLPSSGPLVYLREPAAQPGLRIDSGVNEGDSVAPHYDPMIAKLIVHADKRETALSQLAAALGNFAIAGVTTNLGFLARLAAHPELAKGQVDTGFIGRNEASLLTPSGSPPPEALALLALSEFLSRQTNDGRTWSTLRGFRLHGRASHTLTFADAAQARYEVTIYNAGRDYEVDVGEQRFAASARRVDDLLHAVLNGHAFRARLAQHEQRRWLFWNGGTYVLSLASNWELDEQAASGERHIAAPMPGRIVRLLIQPGKQVKAGTPLLILEAMKMEHSIAAPTDGQVRGYRYQEGDSVEEGVVLFDFEAKA